MTQPTPLALSLFVSALSVWLNMVKLLFLRKVGWVKKSSAGGRMLVKVRPYVPSKNSEPLKSTLCFLPRRGAKKTGLIKELDQDARSGGEEGLSP